MINKKFIFEKIKWPAFLFFLLSVILLLFFLSYIDVKSNAVAEFNKQQMILAEQAATGINEFFETLEDEMKFLVNMYDVTELNENGQKILLDYFNNKKPILSSISRMNTEGKLIWLIPYNEKLIGADISYQKHVQHVLKTQTSTISDVFLAVQGYRAIAYHYPIIKNGKFMGSMALLIDFRYISKKYLDNITIGETGYAWMISRDGIILHIPNQNLIGYSVYDKFGGFPEMIKTSESMMRGEKGTSDYRYDHVRDESVNLKLKHAAYTPVNILNAHWSIAVATPEDYIISNVQGFRNKAIIIVLLFIGIGFVFIFFARKNILLSNEIENRKKNEIILKAQEENLRVTLNSIGDAVIAADKNGNISRMNPAAEEITGLSFSAAEGKSILNIFSNIDWSIGQKQNNPFELVLLKGEKNVQFHDIMFNRKDGSCLEISGSYAAINDITDSILGSVLVFRDVTEKNKIEKQLHQAQKMDVVGQLAGGVAHDFNNMLSGIMGSAELLSYESGENSNFKHHIEIIIESARRSSVLISRLLSFSRKGRTISSNIDIHELIKSAIDLLERSIDKKIKIITSLDAENSFTVGDPALLQNAILNLSINARDAMLDGGKILISTSNIYMDEDLIRQYSLSIESGHFIEVKVSDSGSGISKDIINKIFDPFFTTKPAGKGTGLGLSSVYETMKDHKGGVAVQSEPGAGAIFRLFFPRGDANSGNVKIPVSSIVKGSGCILVVDDEPILRETMQKILVSAGYTVILAEDGISAIDIYKLEKERILLVILDMIMPKMSGSETFLELMKISPEIKVIFSSGFNNEGTTQDLLNSGARGFIQKPYQIADFTSLVYDVIHSEK